MTEKNEKKNKFLQAMAGHVLQHGLNTASMRPLAKAAGTSDRMLIYHFGNKETLVAELLKYLASMLTGMMTAALPSERATSQRQCVSDVVELMRQPQALGFRRIWFDIISAAANGEDAHCETAQEILQGFHSWFLQRLPENEPDPEKTASSLLTLIEGILVMDALGLSSHADEAIARLD